MRARENAGARGVSLLELLLVVAILGVLLSVGSLIFYQFLQKLRLNEAVRVVSATLERMSDDALRLNARVVIDEATLLAEPDLLRWTSGSDEVGRKRLPSGTQLSIVNRPSVAVLDFSSRGLPYRQLSFEVVRAGLQHRVTLLPTGMVVP